MWWADPEQPGARRWAVITGDCRETMATLEADSVDAIVTDPPYELGFMGKSWDASGIAYDLEVWRQALRVLKPGGHLLAFSGSRTYHRMACAIEDAGFEIRDQIMWVYGSGFPKSHDVSKAIDREAGAEREVVGEKITGKARTDEGWNGGQQMVNITAPATDAARTWSGWGTALKPAHEPIVVARKPFKGTVAQNVMQHGTGALNIDGCRVGFANESDRESIANAKWTVRSGVTDNFTGKGGFMTSNADGTVLNGSDHMNDRGRWPANLIHDGSDEVLRLFPETAPSKAMQRGAFKIFEQGEGQWIGASTYRGHDDAGGSAARFFYCAKASKRDREDGLVGFEAVRTGGMQATADGSMLTGSGNERTTTRANHHPTVKPTELMRYLCRLVTPPGGLVLDPFTGSGSTGRGAVLEGFGFIGCELSQEYSAIARARIQAAADRADL